MLEDGDTRFKEVPDTKTERLLNHIATNAEAKGMKIYPNKTSLMCVSASTSFLPKVRVKVQDQVVKGQNSMKMLGVTLDCDRSFRTHISNMRSRLRRRTWALSKLRKKGLCEEKLIKAYTSLIRPVVEHASPVWHSSITAEQSEVLERQQIQALKNIYGTGLSAQKMRIKADIPTLRARRERMRF